MLALAIAVIGVLAWLLLGRTAEPARPAVPVVVQPAAPSVIRGTVTAVRQADNLPTYVLTDLGTRQGVKPGDRLHLVRNGQSVATLLVETVADDGTGSACRIQPESVAAGVVLTVATAETIEKR